MIYKFPPFSNSIAKSSRRFVANKNTFIIILKTFTLTW